MSVNISTRTVISVFASVFVLLYLLGVYWSFEPDSFDIREEVTQAAKAENVTPFHHQSF